MNEQEEKILARNQEISNGKFMTKKIYIVCLSIMLISACGSGQKEGDQQILVSVGKGTLTLEKLNKDLLPSMQPEFSQEQISSYIQQWIEVELIYQEALRSGLENDRALKEELEKAKRELIVQRYLEKSLSEVETATEADARGYYDENRDSYIFANDEIKALHILVPTIDAANSARRRIVSGEDFEKVAREVVTDSIAKGRIHLDFFSQNDVIPELSQRLFNGSEVVGSLTNPIKSDFGYHILKILDLRKKGGYREFEDVKDQILARLNSMKRSEKYNDLILSLRDKTNIKKNNDVIKQVYDDSNAEKSTEVIDNLK